MKLKRARVQNYRSVHDTGWFEVEGDKTVLVGPNEAGKTAVLRALQTLKMPPGDESELDTLNDYPRGRYNDIDTGKVDPSEAPVASAAFTLDDDDRAVLAEHAAHYAHAKELVVTRFHSGDVRYEIDDIKRASTFGEIEKPLSRLRAHLGKQDETAVAHAAALDEVIKEFVANNLLLGRRASALDEWLATAYGLLDTDDDKAENTFDEVQASVRRASQSAAAWDALWTRVPFFVYFSQYYKVRPRIHLGLLADRQAQGDFDMEVDFGNLCLLKILGFDAADLSELGQGAPAVRTDNQGRTVRPSEEAVTEYEARVKKRTYRLDSASMELTKQISKVWGEQRPVDVTADGQYLNVVTRLEDGARVELDQGSEGFRWLVSFYVVFTAQAQDELANAILLLDEPGVSLHALKQKQFRQTVSQIAEKNQTLFTTHSPFMVGTDELERVRIVEMTSREEGTKVHEDLGIGNPDSLFPLQAHLGYELGQTLFGQRRNLVVEGITDYWYIQAATEAAADAGQKALDDKVTLLPAGDAGKVVYHASALHAQGLHVAALFDSDTAGETAANGETFSSLFKPKQILRAGDFYAGPVAKPEIEDLIRDTLLTVANEVLGIDASDTASQQPKRPVVDVLDDTAPDGLQKYRLAKAFLRWMRDHGWDDLQAHEQTALLALFTAANKGTR